MPPFRQPYGSAIGFTNHFGSGGPGGNNTAGLFVSGDTTPDVTLGDLFIANNTSATVITYFDLQNYSNRAADYFGKVVKVLLVDQGSTQFANSGQLYLYGTNNLGTKNAYALYEFAHVNSAWIQVNNSELNRREVGVTGSVGGSIALSADNVDDRKYLYIQGTGATTIVGISGGTVGQELYIMANSQGITYSFNSAATLALGGTNAFVFNALGVAHFIKRDATNWALVATTPGGI